MPENSRVWSVCYVGHVTRGDLLEIWVNSFFFLSFSAFPRFSRTCTSKQHVMIVSFNCRLKRGSSCILAPPLGKFGAFHPPKSWMKTSGDHLQEKALRYLCTAVQPP